MAGRSQAVHRTILAVDIAGFGDPRRTNPHQIQARHGLYESLGTAFADAGLVWRDCYHEDRGDGLFALIPPDVPKNRLVAGFPRAFAAALRRYNETAVEPARIQVRMVVHAGEVHHDEHGIAGAALNHAFRLLDAGALKTALSGSPGVLAVIVSGWFYDEVVRHEPASRPGTYRPVPVSVKETTTDAWICLPDHPYPHSAHNPDKRVPKIPGSPTTVPRQLPAPIPGFVGRAAELEALTEWLDHRAHDGPEMAISVIEGMGGIGKTWLALHWAHQHIDWFPDGQLYANLHGFDPLAAPTPPAVAVRGFLDALGVHSAAIPVDLEGRTALYRSLVAGRRMLIVLDSARDSNQLVPLLPGSPTCAVLITSRHQLTSLATTHGTHSVDLDVLPDSEARALLDQHLGADRLAAEPAAVTELLTLCAGLPLALGIAVARATTHLDFPLAGLVAELREAADRLDALDTGDLAVNVRVVLSSSYTALDPAAAELFRLLGVAPGPDIGLPAVASLVGESAPKTRTLVRRLERAYLIQQYLPDRYRLHDLARLYAAEQAAAQPGDAMGAAQRRLVDHYTHTALAGDLLLYPHGEPMALDEPTPGCRPQQLVDGNAALHWFLTEHQHLLAAQRLAVDRGWHAQVWHLAWALDTFHWWRGHLLDNLDSWRLALAAADHLGASRLAHTHWLLGDTCRAFGMHDEALDHLAKALSFGQDAGDGYAQARAHDVLAQVWERHGDDRQALAHADQALELYRTLHRPVWEANSLNDIGWFLDRLGRHDEARDHCEVALAMHREHGNKSGEAATLNSLGHIAHHTGQHAEAVRCHRAALRLFREVGNLYEAANTLADLGALHASLGRANGARDAWTQALAIYRTQHRASDAEVLEQQLAALP